MQESEALPMLQATQYTHASFPSYSTGSNSYHENDLHKEAYATWGPVSVFILIPVRIPEENFEAPDKSKNDTKHQLMRKKEWLVDMLRKVNELCGSFYFAAISPTYIYTYLKTSVTPTRAPSPVLTQNTHTNYYR